MNDPRSGSSAGPLAAPARALYTPGQVVAGSLFATPAGGGALLTLTLWRLGRRVEAGLVFVLCWGLALALGAGAQALGAEVGEKAVAAVVFAATLVAGLMGRLARVLTVRPLAEHLVAGGRLASSWRALPLALAWGLVLVGPFLARDWVPDQLEVHVGDRLEAGDALAAERAATLLILLRPGSPGAHGLRGRARTLLGRHDEALVDHDRALGLEPDDPWLLTERAFTRLERREPARALADLSAALAADRRAVRPAELRARAREALGDRGGALADMLEALRRRPGDGRLASEVERLRRPGA